jgi:polysialic acid transport protein|nr:SLBB domain-containing protein [uncultured Capnocytophaga sp.]
MTKKILLMLILSISILTKLSAQNLNIEQLAYINIDQISDEQIQAFWDKAQAQGYSLTDLETAAQVKGIPSSQISKLRQRIMTLSTSRVNKNNNSQTNKTSSNTQEVFGRTPINRAKDSLTLTKKNRLFGYDFFQNPKISFAPTINVPTPESYIINTGDELLIEVWGATENSTTQKVDNQGNIILPLAGKVHVGGLNFTEAKARINTALRRIYAGIAAPEGSYSKIYTGVSIANIRTVKVNIIGEVQAPGTYSISALSNVINALYASGGPTKNGSFRNIQVVRSGKTIATLDIYDFLLKGSQQGNINLIDQDVIIVPPYRNQVEVIGFVKREGLYEVKEGEKLSNLIDFFGGFSANAYKDNLVIERISGAKREVKEVALSEAEKFAIYGGDKLIVHKLSDIYHNKISITGAVYQPGNYAYKDGMTVLDLINKAAGIRDEAYLNRAILFRTLNRVDKQSVNFSLKDILEQKQTIPLQANDSLHIYGRDSLSLKYFVRIEGAVRKPQQVPFAKGMTPEDLIIIAGGFIEGADHSQVQVARQTNDTNFKIISNIQNVPLSENLEGKQSIELEPYDIVTVRFQKGYTPQQIVKIEGEIAFPGSYAILSKEERISSLIERAGGFAPYAYIEGATLLRKKRQEKEDNTQEKQLKKLKKVDKELSIIETTDTNTEERKENEEKNEYRVGINLKKIMKNKNSYEDLILKEDDILIIPSEKQTVEVKGLVLAPSLVRYEKGKSTKSYINSAGGFSDNAQKRSVYVMYSNGDVKGTKKFLFFKSYPKVAPGSIVIVPEKPERKGMTATETISITTAITTLAILIYNTFK